MLGAELVGMAVSYKGVVITPAVGVGQDDFTVNSFDIFLPPSVATA